MLTISPPTFIAISLDYFLPLIFLFLLSQQKNNINSIKMIEYTTFILIVMPL